VGVLPVGRFRREELAERLSVRLGGLLPIGPDGIPALAETFLIGVAVLRNDGLDPLWMANGKSETCWRAIVKDLNRKPIEADELGEAVDHARDIVERVAELISRRHVGAAEARKGRRDHMEHVGEERNKVTKHVTGAREAVQQEELPCISCSRFTIEDLETIDINTAKSDKPHETLPVCDLNSLPSSGAAIKRCVSGGRTVVFDRLECQVEASLQSGRPSRTVTHLARLAVCWEQQNPTAQRVGG
jgi:hypothetical protein